MCAGHCQARGVLRVCISFLPELRPPPLPEPARKLVCLNLDCTLESPGQLLSQHRPHPGAINSEFLGVGPRPPYCLKPAGDYIVQSSSRTPALEGPDCTGLAAFVSASVWLRRHTPGAASTRAAEPGKELAAARPLQPAASSRALGPIALPPQEGTRAWKARRPGQKESPASLEGIWHCPQRRAGREAPGPDSRHSRIVFHSKE